MQRLIHIHTHWVQGATECREVGVRLQERGHPKRRLLLSLFNCWFERLFEGPFNCHIDGAVKTTRLFSPFLLIYPLMTPIKNAHTSADTALFCLFCPSCCSLCWHLFLISPTRHISSIVLSFTLVFLPMLVYFPVRFTHQTKKWMLQATVTQWSLKAKLI